MDAANNSLVVVTGAQGFIGRAVRRLLQREGYPVLAIDQAPIESAARNFGVEREIRLDITDAKRLRGIFEEQKITGVIHLAAILPTIAQREPLRATQVNVIASANLLEMARDFGVRRFVFASSLSAYGTYPADQVVCEESHAAPEDVYGAAKLCVEQIGAASRELQFVSLRIGRVVGPGARSKTSAWRSEIFELLHANVPTEISIPYASSERLLLVHVDDVAAALVMLLRADHVAHSVYNAPCESMVVGDLKREVERLNSHINVTMGEAGATCNPRLVDWSRLGEEFVVSVPPIFDRLARIAG